MGTSGWTVLEWGAWGGFLVNHVLPDARRLVAWPGEGLHASADGPLLCHINRTRPRTAYPDLEAWCAARAERGFPPCNGYCTTIDKWAVQEACGRLSLPLARAVPGGDPDERLAVKARANHGGKHDDSAERPPVGLPSPPGWPYPGRIWVLPRREVPDAAWKHAAIAIERFITNRTGTFHRAYVAGRYVGAATSRSQRTMKEMLHRTSDGFRSCADGAALSDDDRDPLSVAFRLAQGMCADFAAIDLAVDDEGTAFAVDVNTTPWWGDDSNSQLISGLRDAFAALAQTGSLYSGRIALSLK